MKPDTLAAVVAVNLPRLRRAADRLTQEALAVRAAVSISVVRKIEQGGGASLSTLEKLAQATGHHPCELFRRPR